MWLCNCSLSLSMPHQLQKCSTSDQRLQAIKALPCSPSSPTITAQKRCLPDSNPQHTCEGWESQAPSIFSGGVNKYLPAPLHFTQKTWNLASNSNFGCRSSCGHLQSHPWSTLWEPTRLPACCPCLCTGIKSLPKPDWSIISSQGSWQPGHEKKM